MPKHISTRFDRLTTEELIRQAQSFAIIAEENRRDVAKLRAAAMRVIANWEHGDLAEAVQSLQDALNETDGY